MVVTPRGSRYPAVPHSAEDAWDVGSCDRDEVARLFVVEGAEALRVDVTRTSGVDASFCFTEPEGAERNPSDVLLVMGRAKTFGPDKTITRVNTALKLSGRTQRSEGEIISDLTVVGVTKVSDVGLPAAVPKQAMDAMVVLLSFGGEPSELANLLPVFGAKCPEVEVVRLATA